LVLTPATDDVVGTEFADKYYADQISRGATITYDREIVSEHLLAFVTGFGSAIQYLEARFAGVAAPPSSTQTRLLNLLQPTAIAQLGPTVLAQIQVRLALLVARRQRADTSAHRPCSAFRAARSSRPTHEPDDPRRHDSGPPDAARRNASAHLPRV
jgi:hypothetical protein